MYGVGNYTVISAHICNFLSPLRSSLSVQQLLLLLYLRCESIAYHASQVADKVGLSDLSVPYPVAFALVMIC